MRRINYNGDFKHGIVLSGNGIIGVPFKLTYYCGSDKANTFEVWFDGQKTSDNLLILNGGKFVVVLFNDHGLKSGKLKVFKEFFFPDNMMPDGEYHYASRETVLDFSGEEEGEPVKLGDKETDEKMQMIMSEIIYNVLRGKSAYEEWLEAGNEGTTEDFFKAMAELYFKETGGKNPFKTEVVDELPSEDSASAGTIYLVRSEGKSGNEYREYIFVNGKFEAFGAPSKDLANEITSNEENMATNDDIDDLFDGEGVATDEDIDDIFDGNREVADDEDIDALFPDE